MHKILISLVVLLLLSATNVNASVKNQSSSLAGSLTRLLGTENGDGAKVLGSVSLLSFYPGFYTDPRVTVPNSVMTPGTTGTTTYVGTQAQHILLQDFYLYAQRESIKVGAQHFASTHVPSCVRAIVSGQAYAYKTNTPIFFPRYVCPDDAMSWERDGTGTGVAAASNWNGDPTTNQLNNKQQYMLVMASGGTMAPGSKIIGNLNSTGSDGGSGFMYGRMYEISSVALQGTGSGIPGSSISCVTRNGDTISPSQGASFTISVSGGRATGITSPASGNYTRYSNAGIYYLPPWEQRRQWTVANGWDGDSAAGNADGRHPKVFSDETNYYYKTTCNGVDYGVTVSVKWQPDWCLTGVTADVDSRSCTTRTDGPNGTNSYYGIFPGGSANTGFLDNIYMIQGRQTYDANYGYTNGVLISGFEVTANYIQTQNSYYGLLLYGSDVVVRDFNDVTSAVQMKIRGGGGIHVLHARFDTPNDQLNSDGHSFEGDHCSTCSVKTWDYIATGSDSTHVAGAQIRLGSDTSVSGASSQNTNFYIGTGNISSELSTGTNSLTAISCAYTNSSTFGANVANTGFGNTAKTQQFTLHTAFGPNCENSVVDQGSINNVSGAIFSGTIPNAGIYVWDGYANGFATAKGLYTISGSGAPVNGTTGLNKAIPGSSYIDYTGGALYTNSGPSSSPVWSAPGATTTQNRTFQITGTQTVADDKTAWIKMITGGTITKAYAICKTGPTGQPLIFDINKSTDNGSSFATIWSTTANRLQIAAGQNNGTQTSFDVTTFNADDVFRVDVKQVGSGTAGADCTVMLKVVQ